jgi:hypothetical protein
MRAELYWIADVPQGRLAIMPRPRSGDWLPDEITSWRQAGLDVVVSLLQPEEVAELGLEAEPELCRTAGLVFNSGSSRFRVGGFYSFGSMQVRIFSRR